MNFKIKNYFENISSKKINSIILSLWIILISVVLILSFKSVKLLMEDILDENGIKDSKIYSNSIGNWVNSTLISVQAYSNMPTIKNMDWENIKPFLDNEISRNKDVFDYMFVADIYGNSNTTLNINENISDKKYFNNGISGETLISKPIMSNLTNKLVNIVVSPIYNENDDVIGIIGGVIDTGRLFDIIKQFKVKHDKSYSYIVDKTGNVIAHPNKEDIMKENITILSDVITQDIKRVSKDILTKNEGSVKYKYNDILTYAYFNKIPNTKDWILISRIPADYINDPVNAKLNIILVIGILGMIILGILSRYISYIMYNKRSKIEEDMRVKEKELKDKTESDNLKTEFLANISHELKTPLNMIFSSVQLLLIYDQGNSLNNKSTKHLNLIKQNSYRLLRLIDNLIDITRIDSGYMMLNLENMNLVEVIENITMSTVEYVESKKRIIQFDTNIEELVMAIDCNKIERIILNLISNAIKFTKEEDRIEININYNNNYVEISVKDTGIGIDNEKIEMIFERFKQIEPLLNRQNEGSGLGLPLVKSLVKMHGGSIIVNSEIGVGTEVIVKLPVKLVDNNTNKSNKISKQTKIEKIDVEFSDIYS